MYGGCAKYNNIAQYSKVEATKKHIMSKKHGIISCTNYTTWYESKYDK